MSPRAPARCRPGHSHRRVRPGRTLQRRIFLWFGATIVFTAVVIGGLFSVLSPTERIRRDQEGFQRFVSARVEDVWERPRERDAMLRGLHRDLHLDVVLVDARGRRIAAAGADCLEPFGRIPLARRDGRPLGRLLVCSQDRHWGGGWRFGLVLLVVLAILWGASGLLARRLFRPLRRLEHMARELAEGDLTARSGLDPRRHGELGMLGVTMDDMAERIETQLADQRELLAAVSHELRTPLARLRVLLEIARERPSDGQVDELEREVLEIDALVGQLLASSRVDFGAMQPRAVDAVELAARALERAGLPADSVEVVGAPVPLLADPTLLARALANLLRNAEQHGGGLRRIEVRFEPSDVFFVVEDDGPGFGAGERDRVFEAFYRGEHRAGGSLGLGLSLVRRIALAHGGDAFVEDRTEGARVGFRVAHESAGA